MDNNDALDAGESSQTSEVVDLFFFCGWNLAPNLDVFCHHFLHIHFFGRDV